MNQSEKQFLTNLYHFYSNGHGVSHCISLATLNSTEKKKVITHYNHLSKLGYIKITYHKSEFYYLDLTDAGIQFVENSLKGSRRIPILQKNKSISVSSFQNTTFENHNQTNNNSDLMSEQKTEKIESFITDIFSGTIAGIASNLIGRILFP